MAGMDDHLASALIDRISTALPRAQAVHLYGSAADRSMRADSDVDLAILMPPGESSSKS
jgi:predicted nucleotidyltransferase